jgi:hypothetical protein
VLSLGLSDQDFRGTRYVSLPAEKLGGHCSKNGHAGYIAGTLALGRYIGTVGFPLQGPTIEDGDAAAARLD